MATSALPSDATMDTWLARRLLLWPLAAAAAAVWTFTALLAPTLSWQPWLLDVASVLVGAAAIVAGGALAFVVRHPVIALPQSRAWRVAFAALASVAAIAVAGVPGVSRTVVISAIGGIAIAAAGWALTKRRS